MTEVRRFPVSAYFALTFAISWGAILGVFGVGPISPDQLETQGAFLYVALLLGPSLAGLVSIGLDSGWIRAGPDMQSSGAASSRGGSRLGGTSSLSSPHRSASDACS
jgi:hypothetical protein